MNKTAAEIYALCLCNQYDFVPLQEKLSQADGATVSHNVIQLPWRGGEAFIFDYGVAVFWQVPDIERRDLLDILQEFAQQPLEDALDDKFTYELNAPQAALKNDHLSLPVDDVVVRLAVSHGIAQSIKLAQYEARVQRSINSSEYIPRSIATTGKSGLRRKELSKLRGHLFLTKSDVMLHYDLLDVPDFFWDHSELQNYYVMIADYLEIKQRIEVLNKKLETIQDLLGMIADEQKHAHSSLLEWIIIWLIAIDILIVLLQEYLF